MPSAFIQFSNAKREEVKQANPDADFGKLGKLLGEMWRALSEEEKAKYASTASVKRASKKASVKAKPEAKSAEGEEEDKSAAAEEKPAAAAAAAAEKVEEDDEPKKASKKATKKKRPVSAYIQFCNANRDKVKASNPKATFGELGKLLGQMWRQQKKATKTVSKR